MTVNFRLYNGLSANSEAMRYMDHPPAPSSLSQISGEIRKMSCSSGSIHYKRAALLSNTSNKDDLLLNPN